MNINLTSQKKVSAISSSQSIGGSYFLRIFLRKNWRNSLDDYPAAYSGPT